MLKKITRLILTLIICFNIVLMQGCIPGFAFIDTNADMVEENAKKLVEALDSRDTQKIKGMFAKNVVNDGYDEKIVQVLEYYKGSFVEFFGKGVVVSDDVISGKRVKVYDISRDIRTTEDEYRIALIWRVEDDNDANNIGIWSMSIIRYEDDYNKSVYWGDGTDENGIYIGKKHVSAYFEQLTKAIYEEKTSEKVGSYFAPKMVAGIENFDEQVSQLMEYTAGTYSHYWNETAQGFYEERATTYLMEYRYFTGEKEYCVAIKWRVEDKDDSENVGIWSLYITEYEGEDIGKVENFQGDGLWTNGINLGVPYQEK